MGSCVSTDNAAGAVVDEAPTSANVITLAGALREYPSYFTAADVLADDDIPSCFVCNSDNLFYDEYIPELDAEEVLRPGQLYFVLPDVKRRYPLSRGDMRELVVKASSALQLGSTKAGQTKRKEKNIVRIMPVLEVDGGQGDEEEVKKKSGDGVNLQGRRSVMGHRTMRRSGPLRGRVGFPRRCSSGATLSTITEVVDHQ